MVEAVRAGFVFASDGKAYRRWRSRVDAGAGHGSVGLTGAQLERVVVGIAMSHPELVAMPGQEPVRHRARPAPAGA